jgi:hypothetical protein
MPAAFGGRVLVVAVVIVMGAVPSWTQVLYGTVVGVVEDPSGGVIPGASVTIVSPLTNVKRQTASDANGAYRFADLPPGIYDLSVTQPGFATFQRTGIPVRADAVVRVDVRMQLAGTAETVTELTELPVPGFRNFQSLLKLVPGFSPPAGAHSLAGNPMGALVTNVNGTSYSNNNTRVDGVSSPWIKSRAVRQ